MAVDILRPSLEAWTQEFKATPWSGKGASLKPPLKGIYDEVLDLEDKSFSTGEPLLLLASLYRKDPRLVRGTTALGFWMSQVDQVESKTASLGRGVARGVYDLKDVYGLQYETIEAIRRRLDKNHIPWDAIKGTDFVRGWVKSGARMPFLEWADINAPAKTPTSASLDEIRGRTESVLLDRQPHYDVERALHLRENIRRALEEKKTRGQIFFAESPISDPYRHTLNEPSFIVAPSTPEYRPEELDMLAEDLVHQIKPDYQGRSTGSALTSEKGLSFPVLLFKRAETAVGYITIRVFPHSALAAFMLAYETGLQKGLYSHTPLMDRISKGLTPRQLAVLKEDPDKLISWLGEQIELARNYSGPRSNLALADI